MGVEWDLQGIYNGLATDLGLSKTSTDRVVKKKTLVPLIANKTGLSIAFLSIVFGSGKKIQKDENIRRKRKCKSDVAILTF